MFCLLVRSNKILNNAFTDKIYKYLQCNPFKHIDEINKIQTTIFWVLFTHYIIVYVNLSIIGKQAFDKYDMNHLFKFSPRFQIRIICLAYTFTN